MNEGLGFSIHEMNAGDGVQMNISDIIFGMVDELLYRPSIQRRFWDEEMNHPSKKTNVW
jgi:hypothetical protein